MGFFTDSFSNAITGSITNEIIKDVGNLVKGSKKPNDSSNESKQTNPTSDSTDFDKLLRSLLTPNGANNVSEEALFAAVVGERIGALKGDKAATEFATMLTENEQRMSRGSYVPYEAAAKATLRQARDQGLVTREESDQIYSQAFAASQLDGNVEALWDDTGGKGDTTIAVATLEDAMARAKIKLAAFDKDSTGLKLRALDEGEAPKLKSIA